MKTNLLLVFTFSISLCFSQTRNCGVKEKMAELTFNPFMKQKYEERQQKFNLELNRLQKTGVSNRSILNNVRIPVAVHFPEAGAANATLRNCLKALAQNQIDILNADYNAQNADMSIWNNTTSSNYPGVNVGSLNINLELATQNHPSISGLTNGDVAVTFGYNYGSGSDWDANWAGYLLIWLLKL